MTHTQHTLVPHGSVALLPLEEPTERVIAPAKRRVKFRELPRDAAVIRVLTARDFKVKYKQSMLGPLWLVFQPLALLLAFLVAFRGLGKVHSSNVPYAVFALVGLSAWAFFQAAMTIGTSSLITNLNFIRYTPCPRVAFPVAAIIAAVPSFVVTAAGAIIGAAATGHLSPRVLLLPFALAWLLLLTAGVVGLASSVAVRYRDVISALPFLLQLGTFLAPVGYSLAGLSPTLRTVVELNPLTGLIEAMRWMMLAGYHASLGPIALSLALTGVLAGAGWAVFTSRETTIADEI
jgi:ABC-type polysaccharide/polyol phosphate export permease